MDTPTLNEKICLCEHRSPCENYALCDITNSFCFPLTDTMYDNFCLLHLAYEKGKKKGYDDGYSEGSYEQREWDGTTKDW